MLIVVINVRTNQVIKYTFLSRYYFKTQDPDCGIVREEVSLLQIYYR